MIQHATTLRFLACDGCGRHPLHIHIIGKERHRCECPRCGTRTALHDNRESAIRAWCDPKAQRERFPLRAVETAAADSPVGVRRIGRG